MHHSDLASKHPVLLGHNIASFDVPLLRRSLQLCQLDLQLPITGFLDTYNIASKVLIKGKDVPNFKQVTLVSVLLNDTYEAHNALGDVKALQSLYTQKL